jgi:transcriptional regulator GlxA family with amidase domain
VAGGTGLENAARDEELLLWLRKAAQRVCRIGSICTGALLLASAGPLDGKRATTHWKWAAELAGRFKHTTVDPDPIYIRDGNTYTTAGITTGMDLALALVEEDLGSPMALKVARKLVLYLRMAGGQSQVSTALSLQASDRKQIEEICSWALDNLKQELPVERLAAKAGMSPLNFARVFVKDTGTTPARFVGRLRVEAARRRSEESQDKLEKVANDGGFGSIQSLRRSFLRVLRVPPDDYRHRFTASPTHRLKHELVLITGQTLCRSNSLKTNRLKLTIKRVTCPGPPLLGDGRECMGRENQPHWSAGFVEHLRSVHFALMTLSVGLILIVLSSEPRYNIGTALTQADQILYLRARWKLAWLLGAGRMRSSDVPVGDLEASTMRDSDVPLGGSDVRQDAEFECGLNNSRMYKCVVSTNWIAVRRDPDTGRTAEAPSFVNPSLPITIVRFQQWWDTLAEGVTFYMPNQFGQGFVEAQDGNGWKRSGETILVRNTTDSKATEVVKFNLRLCNPDGRGVPVELESEAGAFDLRGKRSVIPIVQIRDTKVNQNSFHDLFKEWKPGTFDETFKDFSVATRDFKSLGVEHARNRLDEESKSATGAEQFEIFGVKIPASLLTSWGILGLLCVELYFLVHLKQLSNKLNADDAGWDTPWLGMYASPLPRVIYFTSITIVPVIAVGLLAAHICADLVSISGMPWNWKLAQDGDKWAPLTVMICVLAFCLSGWLGWLSWIYRPRLNTKSRAQRPSA